MSAFLDARTIPAGTLVETDLVIVGGGPAGISLALALANTPIKVTLLESGGMEFDDKTQALYAGTQSGVQYLALDGSRLRFLGGSSNHWGGWTRPLDPSDFEKRDWLPYSGWPFSRKEIEPYFPRAQELVEAGPLTYDTAEVFSDELGHVIGLGDGGVYTSYFQFSKWKDNSDNLPTHFGERYAEDLKKIPNLNLMLHANVTALRLNTDAKSLDHLDVAVLGGKTFKLKAKHTVLACGAMENTRLLLASTDVMKSGVGNQNDLVGRFFADHAIPRDTATMVLFNGSIPGFYQGSGKAHGAVFRKTFSPTEAFKKDNMVLGSLTTVENSVPLDATGRAMVAATADALGIDGGNAKAFSLGCGLEMAPDPDRRLTLTNDRDALGLPRLKLNMTISDSDFAHYRDTMKELGRQLLLAKSGVIRLNQTSRKEWLSVMDWGNHHMGTTRMHEDPKQGVVDAQQRVHGIANLFVAGSSVFPTYGSSNPTMNLVALTLRLGDHLKGLFP